MKNKQDKKQFLLGYRTEGVKLYKPRLNRKKQILLLVAAVPFILTIGTNWIYLLGLKMLSKFNPLWIYN